ncbi:hypothetical protein TrLO_g1304 [Triparma laevis f. longispina]|nr:hypothetical protein TrLO_g1304 [Triparma laevis f. longispina]
MDQSSYGHGVTNRNSPAHPQPAHHTSVVPIDIVPVTSSTHSASSSDDSSPDSDQCLYYEISKIIQDDSPHASSQNEPNSLLQRLKPQLHSIKFTNYFTETITIKQLQTKTIRSPQTDRPTPLPCWQTILKDHRLMPSPHCEKDGTIEVEILVSQFDPRFYDKTSDKSLRIYLNQTSPLWKEWELRDIEFVGRTEQIHRTRRQSRKQNSTNSAWPPVGSAGSSLRNKLSSPSPRDYSNNENEEVGDVWRGGNLPGAVLDKLARKISDQMAMLRGRDRLMRSQGAAFLEVADVEGEVRSIKEEIKEEGGRERRRTVGGGGGREKR